MQMIVAAVVACLWMCYADALQCKTCMQVKYDTDNDQIKQMLSMVDAISDVDCADRAGSSSVETEACPTDGQLSSVKPVCMTMAVGGTFQVPNVDDKVRVTLFQRACHVISTTENVGECQSLSKEMKDAIKDGMGGMADHYSNVDGKYCTCEEDNCNFAKPPPISGSAGAMGGAVLFASLLSFLALVLF